MWKRLRKGSLTPNKWLHIDQVMLNTVRWCGAYLCGMGEQWGGGKFIWAGMGEILETFFSRKMFLLRDVLQLVEWKIDVKNECHVSMNIYELASHGPTFYSELTGAMSTAYGTGYDEYLVGQTSSVNLYSFEFNSLIGSYPTSYEKRRGRNRESLNVGLAHSVVLAKHLGVEKLKRIREYCNHYRVPLGSIRRNAFRIIHEQTDSGKLDTEIWAMLESIRCNIPLFLYRMQALALWEEATSWRVLQPSAHQDIWNSIECAKLFRTENEEKVLHKPPHGVNIFDYCAEWTKQHIRSKSSLGVILETVRNFLAEWITESVREPVWETEITKYCFEFNLDEASDLFEPENEGFRMYPQHRLIWIFQRELQREVAQMRNKDENLPGNGALIILFWLGFPLLNIVKMQDAEGSSCTHASQDRIQEARTVSSSNIHSSVDVSVQYWRAWTILAPQNVSLVFRVDLSNRRVSLRMHIHEGDARFKWQDWVDAAMGYMKGLEEKGDGDSGYGRQILRVDLRKPIVELCPLRMNLYGMNPVVQKTNTARAWTGWPAFDVRICMFEFEQCLAACDVNMMGECVPHHEIKRVENMIEAMKSEENEDMSGSMQHSED